MQFSLCVVDMAFGAQEGTEYSFDFYFQAIIAGNYMIRDVLSREVLEIDYLDQSRYNAKVTYFSLNCNS